MKKTLRSTYPALLGGGLIELVLRGNRSMRASDRCRRQKSSVSCFFPSEMQLQGWVQDCYLDVSKVILELLRRFLTFLRSKNNFSSLWEPWRMSFSGAFGSLRASHRFRRQKSPLNDILQSSQRLEKLILTSKMSKTFLTTPK